MKYLLAVTLAAAALAAWLFPRALPVVVLADPIGREEALQRADAFARAHGLPAGSRTAIQFLRSDSLITFVELAGGGKDSLDALVRGSDVAPFTWSVRHFTPRRVQETRVHLAADGRVTGFERRLADADVRPQLSSDSAQRMATHVLTAWMEEAPERWRLTASSYETRKTSARVDRTYTFERADRRIAHAPIRMDIVIAGDTPSEARRYVAIPEGFQRRYAGMRSANELYTLAATIGLLGIVIAGAVALRRFARGREVRWGAPLAVGTVIGVLLALSGLNGMSSEWFGYDTATSAVTFQLMMVVGAVAIGAAVALVTAVTLAAAEAATRAAFPDHLDWWGLWKHRGTREVATRVMGGYALAAVALAYVAVFYLVTRQLFGWWVPSELLDDPNLIATPAPWLAGIAMSLHAAVWEEAMFRALPLSLLSLWVGARPRRALWMAGGVIATALVFGFAHASYPSWPAYSRGVEIFLDAVLWAAVFLRFGLIVTVVAHFLYNATLFGMFAAAGSALSYRVTAAIVLLAILTPALVVAVRWARQRGLAVAPPDARMGAWMPPGDSAEPVVPEETAAPTLVDARTRQAALATIVVGILVVLLAPTREVLGRRFTAPMPEVTRTADSLLAVRGVDVRRWKRLTGMGRENAGASSRFLQQHEREDLAQALATTYAIPVWWEVRYVRPEGQVSERAEEWRVRIRPDGVPMNVHHVVPDSAPGARPDQDEARRIARAELARSGLDTGRLMEAKLEETARPERLDVRVTYTDTTVRLPGGAAARVWVSLAGTEPVRIRRSIELPEEFIRADRDRQMRRALVAGLSGILLVGLVIIGAVRVTRRRQPALEGSDVSRRPVVVGLVITGVLVLASALNDYPAMLFGYDTSETWSSFLTSRLLGVVASGVVFVLVLAALWLAVHALRRRVGIPIVTGLRSGGRPSDVLLAGAGLGAAFATVQTLRALARAGIPRPPGTSLVEAVPVLSEVLSLPAFVLTMVPMVAIPVLLIVAVARGWPARALLGVAALVLVAGITAPASTGPVDPLAVAMSAAGIVALVLAIRAWGGMGLAAWMVAGLTAHALGGVRGAMQAANAVDVWAEVLGIAAAVGAVVAIGRLAIRFPISVTERR